MNRSIHTCTIYVRYGQWKDIYDGNKTKTTTYMDEMGGLDLSGILGGILFLGMCILLTGCFGSQEEIEVQMGKTEESFALKEEQTEMTAVLVKGEYIYQVKRVSDPEKDCIYEEFG